MCLLYYVYVIHFGKDFYRVCSLQNLRGLICRDAVPVCYICKERCSKQVSLTAYKYDIPLCLRLRTVIRYVRFNIYINLYSMS